MRVSKEYRKALKELFSALPYGSIQAIAKEAGLSRWAVERVRDCKFRNDAVVEIAKRKLQEHNETQREDEAELINFVEKEVRHKRVV